MTDRISWYEDLGRETIDVVHAGVNTYPLSDGIRAAVSQLTTDLIPPTRSG